MAIRETDPPDPTGGVGSLSLARIVEAGFRGSMGWRYPLWVSMKRTLEFSGRGG